jgi:hypothetical protein
MVASTMYGKSNVKFVPRYVQIAWNKHRRVIVMRPDEVLMSLPVWLRLKSADCVCTYARGDIGINTNMQAT